MKKIKVKNNEHICDSYTKMIVILMVNILILKKSSVSIAIKLEWLFPICEIFRGFCFQVMLGPYVMKATVMLVCPVTTTVTGK